MYKQIKEFILKYQKTILCVTITLSVGLILLFSNKTNNIVINQTNKSEMSQTLEIKKGDQVKQKYIPQVMLLKSFTLYPRQITELPITIDVDVISTTRGSIFKKLYNIKKEQNSLQVTLDGREPQVGERFNIIIQITEESHGDTLFLSTEKDQITDKNIIINNIESKGALSIEASGYDVFYSLKIIVVASILLLFSLLFAFKYIMKQKSEIKKNEIDKIWNWLKQKKLLFIIEFLLAIILLAVSFTLIYQLEYYRIISFYIVILFIVVLCIFILYFQKLYLYCKKNYSRLFLLLAIPIGLCYCIFIIPDGTPDEPVHFLKTYLVSTLNFTNISNVRVPSEYQYFAIRNYSTLFDHVFTSTNYSDSYLSVQAVGYNAILYLAPGFTIAISKVLGASIFGAYLLAKISNLILFLFLGYKAIKITPYGKLIFFIYLLNPMMLQQASSLSADCLIHAISILFISFNLKIIFSSEKIKNKDIIFFILFFAFFAITKFIYLPLFALMLIFFKKIKQLTKKQWLCVILGILISILIIYIIYKFVPSGIQSTDDVYRQPGQGGVPDGVNAIAQFKNLISNPFFLFNMIWNTLGELGIFFVETFFGKLLAWLDLPINILALLLYQVLFFISPLVIQEKLQFKKSNKIWIATIFIGMTALIIIAFFLQWTPVGMLTAYGIQGRYFIPFALLFLLAYSGKRIILIKNIKLFYTLLLILSHAIIISNIITWYTFR